MTFPMIRLFSCYRANPVGDPPTQLRSPESRHAALDQRWLIATDRSHCHGRAWPCHPRLPRLRRPKDVVAGPSPAMTVGATHGSSSMRGPEACATLPAAHSGRIQAAHGAAYVPRPPHEIPMPTRCRLVTRAAPTRNPTAGACPRTSAERWHIPDANRRGKARHSPCPKWNERSQGAMSPRRSPRAKHSRISTGWSGRHMQHDRRLMRLSGARRTSQLRLQPIPSQPIRFSSSPTPRFSSPRADWRSAHTGLEAAAATRS